MNSNNLFRLLKLSLKQQVMGYHKVFVYGTLKKGQPNHNWLTKKENGFSQFVAVGKTATKYPLIIATKYNIPFLLYSPGNGKHVMGEIYEVDDQMLQNLDTLEEHPTFYEREIHQVSIVKHLEKDLVLESTEEYVNCWIYFIKRFRADLLNQEVYSDYKSDSTNGKEYCPRYIRDPQYNYKMDIQNSCDS